MEIQSSPLLVFSFNGTLYFIKFRDKISSSFKTSACKQESWFYKLVNATSSELGFKSIKMFNLLSVWQMNNRPKFARELVSG